MLDSCIYNNLNHILPYTAESKNDILNLEYLSACKIMQNKKDILKILQILPARLYKSLLQSLIYNCYMKFINSMHISGPHYYKSLDEIVISFPETLGILVLNWPYQELILRNQIPSLEPPFDIFKSLKFASQRLAIVQVDDMLRVFNLFCKRLIQIIIQAVFKCTSTHTQLVSYNLRRLDVSGLVNAGLNSRSPLLSDEFLEGIRNSKIDTFGHKIEIYGDANAVEFGLLRNVIEQSFNTDKGISIYLKTIGMSTLSSVATLPIDFYNMLVRSSCEYIQLSGFNIDQSFAENLEFYHPRLVGLSLECQRLIENLEFLSSFQYLEQLCIRYYTHNGLTNAICEMSKGLKYLSLVSCSLKRQDFECLAASIHSDTLLQFDIRDNKISNDSEAVGLITLCQNMKNVKILLFDECSLHTLSLNTVSTLVDAFKDCDSLEFLSIKLNQFILEITTIIIDGLAQKHLLRYLSIDLPKMPRNGRRIKVDENMEYRQNLLKKFHEKINKSRQSPIYISWRQ